MEEFKVNEYISLKLENNRTYMDAGGEQFHKCNYLLLNIPIEEIKSFDQINSIDEPIFNVYKHQPLINNGLFSL